jgi:hypothetical protein
MQPRLSQTLRLYAEQLEREYFDDLSPEERKEAEHTLSFWSNLVKLIVVSRERLLQDTLVQLDPFGSGSQTRGRAAAR